MALSKRTGLLSCVAAIALLFPFCYLIANLLAIGVPDLPNGGDGALLEMSTRNVFSRRILLGPYSRFLFFHPGPMYYIIRYPIYMIMGQRSSSFLVATILIAAGSMFGVWKAVRKKIGETAGVAAVLVFSLFLVVMDKTLWLSEWNPHIIMFPILLFIVISALFAAGDYRCFTGCVVVGTFVAQTHLGSIPLLMAVFATSILLLAYPRIIGVKNETSPAFKWKHILPGVLLLLVLWAPPIYEQISSEKGNMTKIQEYFEDNHPGITVAQGLRHWSTVVTRFELDRFMPALRRSGAHENASLVVVSLRLLLLSAIYGLLRRNRRSDFLCAVSFLVIIAHAITLYSVTQIRGAVNDYLIEWMSAIAPLSYITIVVSCTAAAGSYLSVSVRRVFLHTAAATVIVFSVFITRDVGGYLRKETDPSWTDVIAVEDLSSTLGVLMSQDPDTYYVLNLQTWNCWTVMTGLMNSLEKQGYNVVMADNIWFKETPVPDGSPSRTLHIGHLSEHGSSSASLVARHDRIGIILE